MGTYRTTHPSNIKIMPFFNTVVITLDGGNSVIAKRTVFMGTLNRSLVHPREVFADAIKENLIPSELTKKQVNIIYATDAVILCRNTFDI